MDTDGMGGVRLERGGMGDTTIWQSNPSYSGATAARNYQEENTDSQTEPGHWDTATLQAWKLGHSTGSSCDCWDWALDREKHRKKRLNCNLNNHYFIVFFFLLSPGQEISIRKFPQEVKKAFSRNAKRPAEGPLPKWEDFFLSFSANRTLPCIGLIFLQPCGTG